MLFVFTRFIGFLLPFAKYVPSFQEEFLIIVLRTRHSKIYHNPQRGCLQNRQKNVRGMRVKFRKYQWTWMFFPDLLTLHENIW